MYAPVALSVKTRKPHSVLHYINSDEIRFLVMACRSGMQALLCT